MGGVVWMIGGGIEDIVNIVWHGRSGVSIQMDLGLCWRCP